MMFCWVHLQLYTVCVCDAKSAAPNLWQLCRLKQYELAHLRVASNTQVGQFKSSRSPRRFYLFFWGE
jgi:hypothetical protein